MRQSVNNNGFSLIEVMVVLTVVALLMGLAAPSLVSLTPSRKSSIYELKTFVDFARRKASSERRDTYVAFADQSFPTDSGKFRAYALFAAYVDEAAVSDAEAPILSQDLIQVTEWRNLEEGLVFAESGDFEVSGNSPFRTLLESPWRRDFETSLDGEETIEIELPFLMFNGSGRVTVPPFHDADTLHLGISEGFYSASEGRVLTYKRGNPNGDQFGQSECIRIGFYTGKPRIISE